MSHFGEDLRRERISRGVALETISASTKVVTRYLSALEDENFDVLPGGILSKGIVRSYARAVGLDESTWVERFLAASAPPVEAVSEDGWVEFAQNVGRSRPHLHGRRGGLRWAGLALLLLLLVGAGWFVWRYVGTRVEARVQPPQPPAIASTLPSTKAP